MTQKIASHAVQRGVKLVPGVKNIVAVASGKGGVGKSTTAVNLALALAAEGATVGVLDADIYGPSQPTMLGIAGRPESTDGKTLEPMEAYGVQAMSIGFLIDVDTPMVWRGPMVTQALEQLLKDTHWRDLDYLIVDMPPGTGDIQLTLSQKVPVTGAVIVTTPQDIALIDARKGLKMFEKVGVPIVGIVENMSVHVCSNCGHAEHIFGEGGGDEDVRATTTCRSSAALPLDIRIREQADSGRPTRGRRSRRQGRADLSRDRAQGGVAVAEKARTSPRSSRRSSSRTREVARRSAACASSERRRQQGRHPVIKVRQVDPPHGGHDGMIEPFEPGQVREVDGRRIVSYGTSSYGYDIRCSREFKIFTNINSTIVDPKAFDAGSFVDFKGDVCIIPPNSFALARTVEYFRIPRNVLVVCFGKSTYARCFRGDTRVALVDGTCGNTGGDGAARGARASFSGGTASAKTDASSFHCSMRRATSVAIRCSKSSSTTAKSFARRPTMNSCSATDSNAAGCIAPAGTIADAAVSRALGVATRSVYQPHQRALAPDASAGRRVESAGRHSIADTAGNAPPPHRFRPPEQPTAEHRADAGLGTHSIAQRRAAIGEEISIPRGHGARARGRAAIRTPPAKRPGNVTGRPRCGDTADPEERLHDRAASSAAAWARDDGARASQPGRDWRERMRLRP